MAIKITSAGGALVWSTAPSAISMCGWVRRLGAGAVGSGGGAGEIETAFAKADSGAGYQSAVGWRPSSSNYGYEYQWSSAAFTKQPRAGDWVFLAFTQTTGTAFKAYIGLRGGTRLEEGSGTAHTLSTAEVTLGSNDWGGYFNGEYAYAKIWDAVLTKTELEREFTQAYPFKKATYFFNPLLASLNAKQDLSSNGKTASVEGTILSASGPSILWRRGTQYNFADKMLFECIDDPITDDTDYIQLSL